MYKYQRVAEAFRESILKGEIKPGEKLPSVLNLAKETGYNTDTIVKAYKLLEEEHLIYAAAKSGYYVVKSTVKPDKKSGVIDLRTVSPPEDINPYKDFYHCMEKSISVYKNKLFEYGIPQGMEELRAVLVKHLMNFQIFTNPQDIFITTGAQQALAILAAMNFPGGRTAVVVEQPTYSVMLCTLACCKVPVIGISRTEEGIDLGELERIFQTGKVKFFYSMSRFQNPTGYCYTKKQKKEILRLAARYEVYIVEDDYVGNLEIREKEDCLYTLGDKEKIIYIHSFSKTLLPGLRLGMAIIPGALHKEFIRHKQSMDLNTPVLTQGALEIYLKSSMYKAHAQRTKTYYKNKMEVLRNACRQHLNAHIKYHIPPTGIYALIETGRVRAETIVNRLEKRGILLNSLESSYLDGFTGIQGIRLCLCCCEDQDIEGAVILINAELEKADKRMNDIRMIDKRMTDKGKGIE